MAFSLKLACGLASLFVYKLNICAVFCHFCANLSNYRPPLYVLQPNIGASNFINLNYFSSLSKTEKRNKKQQQYQHTSVQSVKLKQLMLCRPESTHFVQFWAQCCVMYPYTAERRDVLENTLPEAQEISQGRGFCPRAISRAEGCKIPTQGKSRGPRWVYFPMHPDSRQCTDILSALAGKY